VSRLFLDLLQHYEVIATASQRENRNVGMSAEKRNCKRGNPYPRRSVSARKIAIWLVVVLLVAMPSYSVGRSLSGTTEVADDSPISYRPCRLIRPQTHRLVSASCRLDFGPKRIVNTVQWLSTAASGAGNLIRTVFVRYDCATVASSILEQEEHDADEGVYYASTRTS
jgi:hypothetical protein